MSSTLALASDKRGTAAIEFALVAPLFLAMVIGTAELALWMWGAAATRDIAARSARCITVTPELCGSMPALRKQMALAAPMIAAVTMISVDKADCGVRVTARGGFRGRMTPGLGEVEAISCGR